MSSKQLKELKFLDAKLDKIEKTFSKKLTSYYDKLESDSLKQVSKYKINSDIKIPASRQKGLENLFKNHFRNIEKISSDYAKKEFIATAKSPEQVELIKKLSPDKINKANLDYAQKLSEKQVSDYQANLKKKLSSSLELNKNLSAKELKEIVNRETQSFKNTRVQATSETEANRVTNETKLELAKKAGIRKVQFIAIMDNRTSDKCIERNNKVFIVGSSSQKKNQPPLHVNCRSYFVSVK